MASQYTWYKSQIQLTMVFIRLPTTPSSCTCLIHYVLTSPFLFLHLEFTDPFCILRLLYVLSLCLEYFLPISCCNLVFIFLWVSAQISAQRIFSLTTWCKCSPLWVHHNSPSFIFLWILIISGLPCSFIHWNIDSVWVYIFFIYFIHCYTFRT